MSIGASIALIAVGAILAFAIDTSIEGIEISTIGLILMVAGVIGLVISLIMLASGRSDTEGRPATRRRRVYRDEP